MFIKFGMGQILLQVSSIKKYQQNNTNWMISSTVPDQFYCPINYDIMDDPVMVADGHTFERHAIMKWFGLGHDTNPLTNVKLNNLQLIANQSLKEKIRKYLGKNSSHHVEQVKEEEVPVGKIKIARLLGQTSEIACLKKKQIEELKKQLRAWKIQFDLDKHNFAQKPIRMNNKCYAGEIINDLMSGRGLCFFSNGAHYEGEWMNNFYHGKGILHDAYGAMYEGGWENGERSGLGICYYDKDFRYEGDWRKGQEDGFGMVMHKEKKIFVGYFKDGFRHGTGIEYCSADDSQFQGNWEHGAKHGMGERSRPDGRKEKEKWVYGEYIYEKKEN